MFKVAQALAGDDGTSEPARLPPDMLCFAVYSAAHAFNRAYRGLLSPHGLTYPQYLVMTLLWAKDGQTLTDLGRPLFLDSGTLTPLLRRLEGAGLVRRTRDTRDERQVRIWLTGEGGALKDALAGVPAQIGCGLGLPPDELRALTERVTEIGLSLRDAADSDPAEPAGA